MSYKVYVLFIIMYNLNILFSGLSGFLPIHPRTYMTAWRNRQQSKTKTESSETATN